MIRSLCGCVNSRRSGFVLLHPSATPIWSFRARSASTAPPSSKCPGALSSPSSTRFKSPSITSGLRSGSSSIILASRSQNSWLSRVWFGAYTTSIFRVLFACHGILASIALPSISVCCVVWSVLIIVLLSTIATPAAFGEVGDGEWYRSRFLENRFLKLFSKSSVIWVSWIARIPMLCTVINLFISNHFSCRTPSTLAVLPHMLRDATLSDALVTVLVRGGALLCGAARSSLLKSMLFGPGVEPVFGSPRCGGSGSLAPRVNCGLDPCWRVVGDGAPRVCRVRIACTGTIERGGM